jgi:hypothetical protein
MKEMHFLATNPATIGAFSRISAMQDIAGELEAKK